jgi:predicted transcriptional regulator
MKKLLAKDIMTSDVICVNMNMDLREVAKLFTEKKITGAPVLDDQDNLIGVVSLTDLVGHELSGDQEVNIESDFYSQLPEEVSFKKGFHIEDFNSAKVSEIMTPTLITAEETSPVNQLASIMLHRHVHRIIITKDKQVKGIVSTMDLLKLLAKKP